MCGAATVEADFDRLVVEEYGPAVPECAETRERDLADPSADDNRDTDAARVAAQRLFDALCLKHRPTAAHSLRVALGALLWGERVGLSEPECRVLELASLLHDVGKLATPDGLLSKCGRLTPDEKALMNRCRESGLMLVGSTVRLPEVGEMIRASHLEFGGGRTAGGDVVPVAARILAIADAFDSMTTHQVYRPALSRDEAVAELWQNAGSQFDPEWVLRFTELADWDPGQLQERVDRLLSGRVGSRAEAPQESIGFGWPSVTPAGMEPGASADVADEEGLAVGTETRCLSSDRSLVRAIFSIRGSFELTALKLRGFISDEDARIISVDDGRICLAIGHQRGRARFGWGPRQSALRMEMELVEFCRITDDLIGNSRSLPWTRIAIDIRPQGRWWRWPAGTEEAARQVIRRLRCYLMVRTSQNAPAV